MTHNVFTEKLRDLLRETMSNDERFREEVQSELTRRHVVPDPAGGFEQVEWNEDIEKDLRAGKTRRFGPYLSEIVIASVEGQHPFGKIMYIAGAIKVVNMKTTDVEQVYAVIHRPDEDGVMSLIERMKAMKRNLAPRSLASLSRSRSRVLPGYPARFGLLLPQSLGR
jgi:hypothetical protein